MTELKKLKKELKGGNIKEVAERVPCSDDWVRKVLRNPKLAVKNPEVIDSAIEVIKEKKEKAAFLSQKIKQALA